MQTLKLDSDNNLVLDRGMLVVIDGIHACAQDTKTRIGLVRGENPYDTTDGTDFYNELLPKMGGIEYLREEIRDRIMASDEIIGIRTLSTENDTATRTLIVTADIATIYGETTI